MNDTRRYIEFCDLRRAHLVLYLISCIIIFLLETALHTEAADEKVSVSFLQIVPNKPNTVLFKSQKAKFLRFNIYSSTGGFPAIDELLVFESDDESTSLNLTQANVKHIETSSCIEGYPIHKTENIIDGKFGNDYSWVASETPSRELPQWVKIEWNEPITIGKIVFSRDRLGTYLDRIPLEIEIELSLDGVDWDKVAVIHGTTSELSSDSLTNYGSDWLTSIPMGEANNWSLINTNISQPLSQYDFSLQEAFLAEENALLKTAGFADCEQWLLQRHYPEYVEPEHKPESIIPLPTFPTLDEVKQGFDVCLDFPWEKTSSESAYAFAPGNFGNGPLVEQRVSAAILNDKLYLKIEGNRFLSNDRAVISCENLPTRGIVFVNKNRVYWRQIDALDERMPGSVVELHGLNNEELGLSIFEIPLTFLPEYNKRGIYVSVCLGCRNTAAGGRPLHFKKANFSAKLQYANQGTDFSLNLNSFDDKNVSLSSNFQDFTLREHDSCKFLLKGVYGLVGPELVLEIRDENNESYRLTGFRYDPCHRPLCQLKDYLERLQSDANEQLDELDFIKGSLIPGAVNRRYVDVEALSSKLNLPEERESLVQFFDDLSVSESDSTSLLSIKNQAIELWAQYRNLLEDQKQASQENKIQYHLRERILFWNIRQLKRELFLSNEELKSLTKILANKRHPFWPSHNYSDLFDSTWNPGGAVVLINIPWENGRLTPEKSTTRELVKGGKGIIRNPSISYDSTKLFYSYRSSLEDYFRIFELDLQTNTTRRISADGPFHDFWPIELPDGDLVFVSTRCKKKFICWRPQAFVLFRMDKNGENIKELSFANLTEFAPSIESDGRIIWTRSEYVDKGADYGHTLWTIRPDGTSPELVFGNTINLPQGYANGRRIPESNEICCTMISHFGDLNGPIAILDTSKGPHEPSSIRSITPEIPWPGFWARTETFREPFPITHDVILVSYAALDRFGVYLIDRFGNRELLTIDDSIDTVCPQPFIVKDVPPIINTQTNDAMARQGLGRFSITNVYKGLEDKVAPGVAKYLRICQEMPTPLAQLENGTYQTDHEPFMEYYASPVDVLQGAFGWTSYVAKGVLGTVKIENDGSADFIAPSGKVLFFELLDENFNEIQRMRSVVQLQPGEQRSCIGCHENRLNTPDGGLTIAAKHEPQTLIAPPWGEGPFWYEKTVQPVLDAHCVQCHTQETASIEPKQLDLTSVRDQNKIPSSYRSLVQSGDVHYFDYTWGGGKTTKAEPYSFGTSQSKIWTVLNDSHHRDLHLNEDELHALKCWIDLNLPLWGDYQKRSDRQ